VGDFFPIPRKLKWFYGRGDLRFIPFVCYRRLALPGTARARNVLLRALRGIGRKTLELGFVD
jgi:hypothetical protein